MSTPLSLNIELRQADQGPGILPAGETDRINPRNTALPRVLKAETPYLSVIPAAALCQATTAIAV